MNIRIIEEGMTVESLSEFNTPHGKIKIGDKGKVVEVKRKYDRITVDFEIIKICAHANNFEYVSSFEKNDIVKVTDNSFVVSIKDGEFKSGYPAGVGKEESPKHRVLATNLKLPIYRHFHGNEGPKDVINKYGYNDTIIENLENGKKYFVMSRHLKLVSRKKKDELEAGDKFKAFDTKYKVVAIGYDDIYDCTDYYAKAISGERPGTMKSILSKTIQEIIYD